MIATRVNEIFQLLSGRDEELLKKCHQCMEIIVSAKDRQAAEANKNASILLEELDLEKSREESKKAAAARKREKRRKKKKEKQEKEKEKEASKNSSPEPENRQDREQEEEKDDIDLEDEEEEEEKMIPVPPPPTATTVSTMGTSIITESKNARNKKNNNSNNMSKAETNTTNSSDTHISTKNKNKRNRRERDRDREQKREQDRMPGHAPRVPTSGSACTPTTSTVSHTSSSSTHSTHTSRRKRSELTTVSTTGIGDLDDFGTLPANLKISPKDKEKGRSKGPNEKNNRVSSLDTFGMPLLSPAKGGGGGAGLKSPGVTSPKRGQKKEEGWKEVIRKSKKVSVPSSAISRVIGRGGCNINAIREVSGAHIEVDKQPQKGSGDRIITIKGSADATRQAHALITALIKDPDKELEQILPKYRNKCANVAVTTISISVTSSNVWHNSMANNIPTTVVTATTTINTPSQKSPPVGRSGNIRQSSPAVSLTTSGMTQSLQGPLGPGSGRHSTGMVLVRPPPSIPLQGTQVQTGTQVWNGFGTNTGSPKRSTNGKLNSSTSVTTTSLQSSMSSVSTIMAHTKSPSAVSRQLFPNEKMALSSQSIATVTKTPVTYTTAPVSKPKTVTSTTTTTFAAKVDNKMQPVGTRNLQRTLGLNTSKPHPNIPSGMAKSDPQPLPIKASVMQMLQQGAMMPANLQASLGQGSGEYSPFNNLFSQVAEQVLGKKDDQNENRMNFASVAAAGVVTTSGASSLPNTSMGPPLPSDADVDPNLPAKAPGYKPMGQGLPGAGIPDMDLAKAPGYRGNIPLHALSHAQVEMEMLKTPGYRGGVPLSQASLSPRSAGSTPGGQSPRDIMAMAGDAAFLLAQHGSRDVYTTHDQPMTLPKIESNLNPNAPDFTSRSTGTPQQSHQGGPPQGFSGTPPLNPNLPPNPSAFRPPHPSLLGQQAFGSMPPPQSGGPFLPGASGNMAVGDFSALQAMTGFGVNASTFSGSGANMNVPSSLPRQYSPLPAGTRSASTTPSVGASSKDGGSPVPAVSSETSPMSSNAPSPTDHVKHTGEDRKLPRPIGTERAQNKKPPGAGYGAGMGDMGPAAGIWGFSQELSSEWISSVSSVMTSSVVTSSSGMTPNSTSDGEERSTGTPGPRMIPRPFLEGGVMDQSMEQTLQGQPMMVPNGNSLQFANGLPPGALPMAALYAQGAMPGAAETIAPLWNQQMKTSASDGTSDPNKLMWNNWNQQPPNM